MVKKLKVVIMILTIITLCLVCTQSFAVDDLKLDTFKPPTKLGGMFITVINVVLGAIQVIGIIISVVTIGYIGLKSVFGSLAEKSEAKQSVGPFFLGALLITSAVTIVRFIVQILE